MIVRGGWVIKALQAVGRRLQVISQRYLKRVRLLWSEAGAVCDLGFCA
jgi:hypothetical protein